MILKKITPNLMVKDVSQTVKFYEDLLGFKLAQSVPEDEPYEWASVKAGDVELMFQESSSLRSDMPIFNDIPIGGALTLFVRMQGIQEIYERIREQVEVVQELNVTFYGMQEFSFKDINGYVLTFAEPAS